MHAKLISIGNSKGIRLPKAVIEQYALGDGIDLGLEANAVVIRPMRQVRQGWDRAFAKMRKAGADKLLDAQTQPGEWDRKEWQW